MKSSSKSERWYQGQLLAFVKTLRKGVEEAMTSDTPFLFDEALKDKGITAFNIERFLSVVKRYQKLDLDNEAKATAAEFVAKANSQNALEVGENLKRQTGIDLAQYLNGNEKVAERVTQLTEANVALIKSIHSQYLEKVQLAVTQAQIKGELNADLAKKIKEIGGVTENRARFIARDQSAKINASLTRARHEELGITHYRWSTSGDERVRDTHAELDGKIFAYDDPPDVGNPGSDFHCRCVAVPVLDKGEIEKAEDIPRKEFKSGKMDLETLIDNSLTGSGNKSFSNIGTIHPDLVELAKETTGLDISDWQHSVDEAGIRHIFKKHGDEKQERLRGQRAVTKADLLLLPLIISKFDSLEYAGTSETGNDIFLVKKEIDDEIFTVQEIRKKNKKLSLKTMWIRRKSKKRKP